MEKTLKQLEDEARNRRAMVDRLTSEYVTCRNRQVEILSEIEDLTGEPAEAYIQQALLVDVQDRIGDTPAARLEDVIRSVLQGEKGGLTKKDISDRVLESGYQTEAKDFESVVYQVLYHADWVEKVGTKKYRLK